MKYVVLQFSTTPWITVPPRWWAILLLRWKNRWSWLIRKFCHSPFSHVDFVLENDPDGFPDGSLLGASDQGKNSPCLAGNPCGVAVRPGNYQAWGYRRRMIIRTDKADAIIKSAKSQLGKPFDKSALLKFMSDEFPNARNWRNPLQWFCAEYSLWSFEDGDYWGHPLPWPKDRATPTDALLVFIADPNFVNVDTFWEPVPGLQLEPWEV